MTKLLTAPENVEDDHTPPAAGVSGMGLMLWSGSQP